MSKKLLVLMSILMLFVVPFASVNAQDVAEGIDYCEILPEADCQILLQSDEVMKDVSSLAFDLSLVYDIAMDSSEMSGMDNINFAIDGNGSIAFDTVLFQEINELAMNDMEAYMQQLPTLMDSVFASVEGEMSLNVTLPEMLAAMGDMPSEIPVNLVMADGVYALDFATLADALGEEANGMTWVGLDLNGAFETMMGEMDFSGMFDSDMMGAMMGMGSGDMTDAVTITRLPDSSVNGQDVAVFEVVFDYAAMLETTGMSETLSEMYSEMGMTQEETDMVLSMLEDISITYRQYVGLVDYYNYRMEFAMNFQMDGETMGEPDMGTVGLDFSMTLDMNDFNVPVDVTVPADAQIFPFEMLMGSGL